MERELLEKIIRAWDSLPRGHYEPSRIENWMNEKMWPVIKEIRVALAYGQPTIPTKEDT